jgi:hypothetical protein
MPTHEGLGADDRDGLEDRWKPSIQLNQEQAIPIREVNATAHPPPQHDQLMSERSYVTRWRRTGWLRRQDSNLCVSEQDSAGRKRAAAIR